MPIKQHIGTDASIGIVAPYCPIREFWNSLRKYFVKKRLHVSPVGLQYVYIGKEQLSCLWKSKLEVGNDRIAQNIFNAAVD